MSLTASVGRLDFGRLDFGRLDFGRLDFGRLDFGRLDFGRLDFGRLDFGDMNIGDLGRLDFGRLDFGDFSPVDFDFGRLDFGVGAGDLGRGADGKGGGFGRLDFGRLDFGGGGEGGADAELTTLLAVAAGLLDPPTGLTAVEQTGPLGVLLNWEAPDARVTAYVVYREEGAEGEVTFTPNSAVGTVVRDVNDVLATTFFDATVVGGTTYTYYVAAQYVEGLEVNESASDTVTVDVSAPNSPPVLDAVGPQTVDELTLLSFTATAIDTDLPANTLTFSVTGAPAGAGIDPGSGVFTWTPTEGQGPGVFPFTVRVTDDGTGTLMDEESITVTVNEVNSAPTLGGVTNATIPELAPYQFQASSTDSDDPVQVPTFSLAGPGVPVGATITAAGAFSWTPAEDQDGLHSFSVVVTDGVVDTTAPISLTVSEVNSAPTLGGVTNATIPELAPYQFQASSTDSDDPVQVPTFSLAGPGVPVGATITAAGAFSWTPAEDQDGLHSFSVVVTDGVVDTTAAISLTVSEVNSAPTLGGVTNATIPELAPYQFQASSTDSDDPVQVPTFSLAGPGVPVGATITAAGAFSWTPAEDQDGLHSFSVVVTDGVVDTTAPISLTVSEVNSAPTLGGVTNATIPELAPYQFQASSTDSDDPVQVPTFSLAGPGVPVGATITAAGAFSWTPAKDQDGLHSFSVVVTDGVVDTTAAISLTVSEVNSAPTLGGVTNATIPELAPYQFQASSTDSDDPVQVPTFSLAGPGVPVGATITAAGAFSWTPAEDQDGLHSFSVVVTDGVVDTTAPISLTVSEVNSAPTLGGVTNATIPELAPYQFQASSTDSDDPVQVPTFSLAGPGVPVGATITAAGAFSWTPAEDQDGLHSFSVVVTDGVVDTTAPISLTVSEVNSAPTLGGVTNATIPELAPYQFQASSTDSDDPVQVPTFSLAGPGVPVGATITAAGAFSWTPAEDQDGLHSFSVVVTDGVVDTTAPISLTVNEVNVAPLLAGIGNQTVDELTLLSFTATATDADLPANTLTFSLTDAPAGAVIDPVTGVFTWTPNATQDPGDYLVTVRVTDDEPLFGEETITVTVLDATPPVVTVVTDPTQLWPPNGRLIPVTVFGTVTDAVSGVDPDAVSFAVSDEYGVFDSSGPVILSVDELTGVGSYSFTVDLEASRNGSDTVDGRVYTITVTALDNSGISGVSGSATINMHDQSN